MAEKQQLRGIVAKRLSHLTEATTHLVTEAETTEDYCRRKNVLVVAETEDLDVSGGKPIRERPGVGPWLTLDHLDEWDVLILYKLDRGFRNHLDFVTFFHEFCDVHGKQIVSVSEDIDMSTRMGKFFASQLVQFAEWELMNMSQRRAAAADVIRRAARWGGGSFTFGYEPYQVQAGGQKAWYLRPHPVYAKETLQMALDLLSGKSIGSIARNLNERGIPTARDVQRIFSGKPRKGYKWTVAAVTQHLRSDSIRGYVLHYVNGSGKPPIRVVDETGEFVRREPLIDDDEMWLRVQAKLDVNTKKLSGARAGSATLLQVAFCGYCGAALHKGGSVKYTHGEKRNNDYYQCRYMRTSCKPSRSVPKDMLEQAVLGKLLDTVGSCEITEKRVIAGEDHSQALLKIGMQIADLTTQHYTRGGLPEFHSRIAALEAEHDRISDLPKEQPKIRRVATGKTFRQQWEEMDDEQRRDYLKSAEVTALVVRRQDLTQAMTFDKTADISENPELDIPQNVICECGDFVVNVNLGMLGDQLEWASAAA
jgi:DNA invertase Pin-like site-specific DNA recombinase